MKTKLFLISMLVIFGLSVNAQWQQTSPDSISASCFAISGNKIFAGTYDEGVFLSYNNGVNWTPCGVATWKIVYALAISDSNIYAAMDNFYGGDIVLTSNNGSSWSEMHGLLPDNFYYAVTVKDSNIYVAISDEIFLSSNNGGTWTTIDNYSTGAHIKSLVISDSNIFVLSNGDLYLSSNNGGSWDTINIGLPTGNTASVQTIAVSNGNIYAATYGNGVFKSSNNGSSWTAINTGITNDTVLSLAIKGDTIFAGSLDGVYFSSDNGSSWKLLNYGFPVNTQVFALAISDSNVFAGTANNGIWKMALSNVGIKEINNNESNLTVYPNPATDELTIKSLQKSTMVIIDIQGQTILQQSLQQGKTDIDISGLAKGVYILRLCSNDKTEVERIVKE